MSDQSQKQAWESSGCTAVQVARGEKLDRISAEVLRDSLGHAGHFQETGLAYVFAPIPIDLCGSRNVISNCDASHSTE